jgi:hypothetical protein
LAEESPAMPRTALQHPGSSARGVSSKNPELSTREDYGTNLTDSGKPAILGALLNRAGMEIQYIGILGYFLLLYRKQSCQSKRSGCREAARERRLYRAAQRGDSSNSPLNETEDRKRHDRDEH